MLSTAVPRKYRTLATEASSASGVPLKVLAAQIDDESGWRPDATSPTGAQGIAQFEPGTWKQWGHGSPDNPSDAFPAYAGYMGSLLQQYRGSLRDALAAYNAGPHNISAGYGYADSILQAAGEPQSAKGSPGSPGNPGQSPSPYRNPLRGVQGLTAERVDQGVDYSGAGPVYALGPGVITSTRNSGWPGGNFIAERLTKGPLAGRFVYVAEDVSPAVQVGQHVTPDTKIGTMFNGGSGIETGFASPPGTGNALGASQFSGSNPTAYGALYSRILHALGAPAGVISGTPRGSVPKGFLKGGLGGLGSGQHQPGNQNQQATDASITSGVGQVISAGGGVLHGSAVVLDRVFAMFAPGQGWRVTFGAATLLAGAGAYKAYTAGDGEGEGHLPLAIALTGVAAIAAFMALRPWPQTSAGPVKPGAYVVDVLEGQPPPSGPSSVSQGEIDLTETFLGSLVALWAAGKIAQGASSIGGILGALGAALGLGGGGGTEVPPVEVPPVVAA